MTSSESLRIFIPTYRRPGAQHTYRALPEEWRRRVVWVVDEQDAEALCLAQRVSGLPEGGVFTLHPPEVKTIAQKRAWILQMTSHARIVMMDDDLRFSVRVAPDTTKLRPATGFDLADRLEQLERELSADIPHVGWSARQGNNNHGAETESGPYACNTRTMYVLGYHVPTVRANAELGRIETREDMDLALQLLRRGLPNQVDFTVAADQTYNAPGGASLERTVETSNADALRLAELHPGLVRVVEKPYKGSVPRKEVVISWKKAFEQGLRNRSPFIQMAAYMAAEGQVAASTATTQQEARFLSGDDLQLYAQTHDALEGEIVQVPPISTPDSGPIKLSPEITGMGLEWPREDL